MAHFSLLSATLAASALVVGCAGNGTCDTPYGKSPQFKACGFANPANPNAQPSASAWKI